MTTKEHIGKALKKAGRIVPGIGSYQDKESLRESDKNLRDHIGTKLFHDKESMERLKTDISRKGSLSFLKDLDDLSRQMDTLSRTITYASRGYRGIFDSNPLDEKALARLYAFDQLFMKEADRLHSFVETMSKKDELDSSMVDKVKDHLAKIEQRIHEREELFKGPSD
jgi:hypothetical protein